MTRRIAPFLVATFILASIASLLFSNLVVALANNVGFFYNTSYTNAQLNGRVLSACINNGNPDGTAVLDSSMANKQTFINTILNYYSNGSGCGYAENGGNTAAANKIRNAIGAKFIIETMSGIDSDRGGSLLNITEWKKRINNPAITIDWQYYAYTRNSSYTTGISPHDDAFEYDSGGYSSLVFKYNGTTVYALKSLCGNPVGSLPGLPKLSVWSVAPTTEVSINGGASTINNTTATAGQTISWTHTINNGGPDSMNADVKYHYQNYNDLGNGTGGDHVFSNGSINGASSSFNSTPSSDSTSTYRVRSSDAGKKFCRSTSASPKSSGDNASVTSSSVCVTISYDYSLTPSVETNPSSVVETGSQFSVIPKIYNSGPSDSKSTSWELDKSINKGAFNSVGSVSNVIYSANTYTNPSPNYTETANYDAGTQLCYKLSVTPHSASDNTTKTSSPTCVAVGKKPKFQILGGNLWTNGTVSTSTSLKGNNIFGSWDEYGIFSSGLITGMASGSAFAPTTGLVNSNLPCSYSNLSFANRDNNGNCASSTKIGQYLNPKTIPDVGASFPVDLNTNKIPATSDLNGLQGVYTTAGDITINGATIKKGEWIVINAPDATITIAGNITYTDETLNSINDIPQLVIIANKIKINGNVKNVDAWLIANKNANINGEIDTCDKEGKTVNDCNLPLVVNGPVMTNKLYLYRTAGSGTGTNSGDPAEVFNMRADAYLWSAARSLNGNKLQSVYTNELPARL